MCSCKQLIKDHRSTSNKCFLGTKHNVDPKWIEHSYLREESQKEFYRFFFQQHHDSDYSKCFIRTDDFDNLVFFNYGLDGYSDTDIQYRPKEDLYCEHDELFLTIDQFNDLQELISLYKIDVVINYLMQIGFYYV